MSQTNEEMPVEYWVTQASKGRNIAECWQAINKAHKQEMKEIVMHMIESVPRVEIDGRMDDWKQKWMNSI